MRRIEVCFQDERAALHEELACQLELPAWYGRNLDALYDCLTAIAEDTQLVLLDWPDSGYGAQMMRAMCDAAQENEKLTVTVEKRET